MNPITTYCVLLANHSVPDSPRLLPTRDVFAASSKHILSQAIFMFTSSEAPTIFHRKVDTIALSTNASLCLLFRHNNLEADLAAFSNLRWRTYRNQNPLGLDAERKFRELGNDRREGGTSIA
jgi:hypothetical protein